jgi:acetyltransferase-like isoleucine patch superfamily enzyme
MDMGQEYAGDRIEHKDEEYMLDNHGNLIHPTVELPEGLALGQGILLGEGVEFLQDGEAGSEPGQIDSFVLIPGKTLLYPGISLGHHTILRADHFGRNSSTGSYTRILEGAGIGSNVKIGSSVRLGKEVTVCEGATIEDNVYISGSGYVDPGVTIGHNCKIKASSPSSLAAGISVHIHEDMEPKTPLPNLRVN